MLAEETTVCRPGTKLDPESEQLLTFATHIMIGRPVECIVHLNRLYPENGFATILPERLAELGILFAESLDTLRTILHCSLRSTTSARRKC